jgi:predicted Zn-dependent peptidase
MTTPDPTTHSGAPRPAVATPQPWTFPTPAEYHTDNGLRVLAFDVPGQYVVSVRILIPISLAEEPRHLEGVTAMVGRLLDEGTARHTPEEFADLLERGGIALGSGISEGGLSVDLDVPKRFLPTALDLLRQALAEPVFPTTEVRRIVRSRLAEIEQERASAPHRAARELIATMIDPEDRASRPSAGTAETIGAITRDDIVARHASAVGPRGATVVVAGDLDGLDVRGLVAGTLGGWTAPGHVLPGVPATPVPAADRVRVVIVDRPGSVQSEISVGVPGPDRHVATGWAPFPVLAFVLGGSPGARVDTVLREDKGYTYGMRSTFRPRVAGGTFVTSGSVRAEVTAEALRLLLDILDTACEGFGADEVRAGVDYIEKTAPGRFATADALADEAASLALEGLPLDFPTTHLRQVAAQTPGDLQAAYRSVVTPGEWTVVVVGDAAGIAEAVGAAASGPVSVVPA